MTMIYGLPNLQLQIQYKLNICSITCKNERKISM